jgi:MFS family permease
MEHEFGTTNVLVVAVAVGVLTSATACVHACEVYDDTNPKHRQAVCGGLPGSNATPCVSVLMLMYAVLLWELASNDKHLALAALAIGVACVGIFIWVLAAEIETGKCRQRRTAVAAILAAGSIGAIAVVVSATGGPLLAEIMAWAGTAICYAAATVWLHPPAAHNVQSGGNDHTTGKSGQLAGPMEIGGTPKNSGQAGEHDKD